MTDKQLISVLCWMTVISSFSQSPLVDVDLEISLDFDNSATKNTDYSGLVSPGSTDVQDMTLSTSTGTFLSEK